jgi:hypothetical protein
MDWRPRQAVSSPQRQFPGEPSSPCAPIGRRKWQQSAPPMPVHPPDQPEDARQWRPVFLLFPRSHALRGNTISTLRVATSAPPPISRAAPPSSWRMRKAPGSIQNVYHWRAGEWRQPVDHGTGEQLSAVPTSRPLCHNSYSLKSTSSFQDTPYPPGSTVTVLKKASFCNNRKRSRRITSLQS